MFKTEQNEEIFYAVKACTGDILHIPKSQIEAFRNRNEVLKQAKSEGWRPGTPLPERYQSHLRVNRANWKRYSGLTFHMQPCRIASRWWNGRNDRTCWRWNQSRTHNWRPPSRPDLIWWIDIWASPRLILNTTNNFAKGVLKATAFETPFSLWRAPRGHGSAGCLAFQATVVLRVLNAHSLPSQTSWGPSTQLVPLISNTKIQVKSGHAISKIFPYFLTKFRVGYKTRFSLRKSHTFQ